ncbi:hypothetical protein [Nevskia ramosa]|uniref:hypothetical protein n=1 Tax=Nevskia ramosa TaxID=64002 RepID=UPI0006851E19|nr:hypothetical protein [Nevskia ramosa]
MAVLFARRDSFYKALPGCDVYDEDRNALTWSGGSPLIAHPPCRAWGGLSHFAKPVPGEKELALWAVDQIRLWGGALEHPVASRLWPAKELPAPGQVDRFGGWTLAVDQDWWGHRAQKRTKLYIVGVDPRDVPLMPFKIVEPSHVVSPSSRIRVGHPSYRPQLRKSEREHTPPDFARWLVDLVRRCRQPMREAA